MSYNELAEAAAERFSLEPELALRAIESKDKDLGVKVGIGSIINYYSHYD